MRLTDMALFMGLSEDNIQDYLNKHSCLYRKYKAKNYIFRQNEKNEKIFILIAGEVVICKDFYTGHRHNVAVFNNAGEMFAEVYAFLQHQSIDYSAYARVDSTVLELPNAMFLQDGVKNNIDLIVLNNFIRILANKAYFLNQKLQILTAKTLRSKLSNLIIANINDSGYWVMNMTREALADYLNVARPSLSRELMNMQKEGLIRIDANKIFVDNQEELYEYL